MPNAKKIVDKVLQGQKIKPNTPAGNLVSKIVCAVAEYEAEIRKELQAEGIAKAKAHGVKFGAKPKLTERQIKAMKRKRAKGVMIQDLMAEYGISKSTVYRLLSQ